MSAVDLVLGGAALLVGLTGAWSPCGFSMVETIGLAGDGTRQRTTIAACATFTLGAIAGGAVTFGLLAALGGLVHGAGGRTANLVAAGIAAVAAVAEARGTRIVPQIRRQLPERWRWTMPMALAAALYGVLLGLGFTTFVLSFGVWALAGISFALGHPEAGLVIGAAFGIGRAIPVVVVAPVVDSRFGVRCIELMAERPALYRGFRIGDALTLTLVAGVLTTTAVATAAKTEVVGGADPSVQGGSLAFQKPNRNGVLRRNGHRVALPGRDPAIGGPYVAVISAGDTVKILNRKSLSQVGSVGAPDVQAVAISGGWLAYLSLKDGHYGLWAHSIRNPANPGQLKRIAAASGSSALGHPSLAGGRLVFAASHPRSNEIKRRNLRAGKGGTVVRSRHALLSSPSVLGRHLLYVRIGRAREGPLATATPPLVESLMLKRMGRRGSGRRVYTRRGGGLLWSTALSAKRAYVTLLHAGPDRILSVGH